MTHDLVIEVGGERYIVVRREFEALVAAVADDGLAAHVEEIDRLHVLEYETGLHAAGLGLDELRAAVGERAEVAR